MNKTLSAVVNIEHGIFSSMMACPAIKMWKLLLHLAQFIVVAGCSGRGVVVQCGDGVHQWMFCSPPNITKTERILTAQLDVRFENRYCQQDGEATHFGLKDNGKQMWANNWCFGTFYLCIGVDSTSEQTQDTALQETSTDPTLSAHILKTSSQATGNGTSSLSNLRHISKKRRVDSKLKFWLMFGVVAGGIVIICLIGLITYNVINCDSKGHEKIKEYGRSKGKVHNKYFRGEKPSTSTLISAEEAYESVYDTIKNVQKIRVQQQSSSTFNIDTNNTNTGSGIQNNNHDGCNFDEINTIKKNSVTFIEQNGTVTQKTKPPNTRHKTCVKIISGEAKVLIEDDSDNTYDHLVNTPRRSTRLSSNYSHLSFEDV
ncbi:uncharacterized protein LOC128234143 [Mya arenaria]|uniref:uncharacterized protein LOC128234143 n=1 Tax=Mya arenaria TaxID=6604 RepID=UPI0022E68A6F|nr:uncharacterized protein LOC128234143 [Mya arenaria]